MTIKAITRSCKVNLQCCNTKLVGAPLNPSNQLGQLLHRGGYKRKGNCAWRGAPACTMSIHHLVGTGVLTIHGMHHAARHLHQSRHQATKSRSQ